MNMKYPHRIVRTRWPIAVLLLTGLGWLSPVSGQSGTVDLALTGTATETSSGIITDNVTIANNGTAGSTGAAVAMTMPSGVTFVAGSSSANCSASWPTVICALGTSLAAGASRVEKVVLQAPNPQATVSRTYTASSNQSDANSADNSLTLSTAGPFIDLSLSGSGSQNAAHLATDNLIISNAGPVTATNVGVTTTLPAGASFVAAASSSGCGVNGQTVTCVIGSLAAGANRAFTIVAQAPSSTNLLSLTFAAAASSSLTDTNAANNTITVAAPVPIDLSINGSGAETSSGLTTESLTLANLGGWTASNVVVTTTLPSGVNFVAASSSAGCTAAWPTVTCAVSNLTANANASLTVVAQAPSTLPSLSLTFKASATQTDSNSANNSVTVTTKNPAFVDLAVTGNGTEDSTGLATDTLTLTNAGPAIATGVTITTTLPNAITLSAGSSSGCTASGQSVICTVANVAANSTATVVVAAKAPPYRLALPLTFSAGSQQPDANTANNSVTVTTQNNAVVDLALTGSGSETAGGVATDSVTVSNAGPGAASSVAITTTLPSGVNFAAGSSSAGCSANGQIVTCAVGSLAANATASVVIAAQDSTPNTSLSLTFAPSSAQSDDNNTNNLATITTVRAITDLALSGIGGETAAGLATDNLTVLNQGPGSASGITITGTLPSGARFTSGSSGCGGSAQTVTCTIASLAANASATVKVSIQTSSGQTSLSVPYSVNGTQLDPDTSNNSATVTTYTTYLTYQYDGNGFISKRAPAGGTASYLFYSKGGQLLGEYTSSGTVTRENIYLGHALVATSNAGITKDGTCTPTGSTTPTYTVTDPLGTPIAGSDACGGMMWQQAYYPYGNRQNFPALGQNDQWFTGKYQDDLSQLVDMGARQYSPAFGRFMSIDPAGVSPGNWHSFNRYEYANNNPYRYVDPNGEAAEDWFPTGPNGEPAPIVATGRAFGALAAYTVGKVTSNNALVDAAVQGMQENRQANVDALIVLSTSGRGKGGEVEESMPKEGRYEFPDQSADEKPYVGQSSNIPNRLEQHENSGRYKPGTATTTEVLGGRTAREISEHQRIQEITGGVPARQSDAVSNKVDPIGPARQHLLSGE